MNTFTSLIVASFAFASVAHGAPLVATNDPTATFGLGAFRLPDTKDAKDKYTIIISEENKKPTPIELPAGASGLVLGSQLIPKGTWTWRYVIQTTALAKITPLGPERTVVKASEMDIRGGDVLTEWMPIEGAASYNFAFSADKSGRLDGEPDWDKPNIKSCTEEEPCVSVTTKRGFYSLPVKEGKRYRWQVVALNSDRITLAQSDYRYIDVAERRTAQLTKAGWTLHRSETLLKPIAGQPAFFGYRASQEEGKARTAAYVAEFALGWSPRGNQASKFYPQTSIEAKLNSTGDNKKEDALRFRAGGYRVESFAEWSVNAKYETERKGGTKKGMLEFNISPTVAGLGDYHAFPGVGPSERDSAGNIPFDKLPIVYLLPAINFGADFGRTFDVGTSIETGRNLRRFHADLKLISKWDRLALMLGVPSIIASAESTLWYLPSAADHVQRISRASLSFGINQEVSFGVNYTVGRNAPTFKFSRSTNAGLEIKF
jgi:hypothetical protein